MRSFSFLRWSLLSISCCAAAVAGCNDTSADNSAPFAATSGSAGSAGVRAPVAGAGMSGMPGEAECQAQVVAAGRTVGACEMCLCQMGKCQMEIAALQGDTNGNALVQCTNMSKCSGQCCLCGAPCDALGGNYAMGACAAQTETAAGVTPGAGALTNGATVSMNCALTGPADNSCARAVRLGDCAAMKCMAECGFNACM